MENKYTIIGNIGSGTYGSVIKVAKDGKMFAMKIMEDDNRKNLISSYIELTILTYAKHINIMTLVDYGIYENDKYAIISPEYKITLQNLIYRTNPDLEYETIKYFSAQLFNGLAYLNKMGVIHRDIKPANLMIGDKDKLELKIIDFGESISKEDTEEEYNTTQDYYAPEVLIKLKQYDDRVDVWAGACVVIELLKYRYIFGDVDNNVELYENILRMTEKTKRPENVNVKDKDNELTKDFTSKYIQSLPYNEPFELLTNSDRYNKDLKEITADEKNNLQTFINKCFTYDYKERPHAVDLLKEKWFYDYTDDPADVPFSDDTTEEKFKTALKECREIKKTTKLNNVTAKLKELYNNKNVNI
jgi:serine/threonine protein kinase